MAKKVRMIGPNTSISMVSSASVLIGALIANQAYAQQPQDGEASEQPTVGAQASPTTDVQMEEVVVYGIKQSLMNAQDMKRDAATVIDAVTASDITSLPDRSVVDALTRVPGVTVEVFEATDDPEHFGAEGSTALVRGLDRTLTQFNGRTSFSATQYGALNLSHIPSELVGAIEVQKNQTASMIEGGIAGTLNLVTRKPFDSPDMQLGGSLKADYGDEAEEWSPNISGLFSDRWDTGIGEVGFLVSLAYSETNTRSEAVGTHDYYEKSNRTQPGLPQGNSVEGIGAPIPGADPDAVYWLPPSMQARAKEDTRDRLGIASSVQWQNADETVLATLEFIRSEGHAVWSERLVQNKDQLGDQFANADIVQVLEIPGLSGLEESFDPATGLFTHGLLAASGVTDYGYAPETRFHDEETYVNDISLDVRWNVNDKLTLNSDLQYVDSGQEMYDHTIHSFFRSDVWLDVRDSHNPQIGFVGEDFRQLTPAQAAAANGSLMLDANGNYWGGNTSSITNPENVHTRSAMDHNTNSEGEALAFSLDADYELDEGWITNVKAGVRFSSRNQVHKSTEYDWGVISPEWSTEHIRSVADYPQFQEVVDFGGDFHDGDAFVPGSVTAFYFPRMEWVRDLGRFENEIRSLVPLEYDPDADANNEGPDDDATWYYTGAEGAGDPFVTLEQRDVEGKAPGSPYAPSRIFEVEEKNSAAYIQLDFDVMDFRMPFFGWHLPFRGNAGLRYVDIDVTTTGFRNFQTPDGGYASPERYYSGTEFVNMPADLQQFMEDRVAEYERAQAAGEEPNYASPAGLEWLNGYSERIDVQPEKFSTVLPSLNLVMNLTDNLLLRFAASKAIYVPHLSLKRASQELDVSIGTEDVPAEQIPTGWEGAPPLAEVEFEGYTGTSVDGSNPFLSPEESINADLGLEWYFSDVGSLSGVVFTKQMDNLIRRGTTQLDVLNPSTGVTEEVIQQNTYDNVGKAAINGIELSYQQVFDMLPGAWSGLGLQANFTYLDTSEDVEADLNTETFGTFVGLPLEGLSPRSYNLIAFYENEFLNTRLAYNFRSQYMLNSRDVIGDRPVYNGDRGTLDYSFTYNVSDQINVGFDIKNLTNEQTQTFYQYDAVGSLHPRNFFINDRTLTFRVSGSF